MRCLGRPRKERGPVLLPVLKMAFLYRRCRGKGRSSAPPFPKESRRHPEPFATHFHKERKASLRHSVLLIWKANANSTSTNVWKTLASSRPNVVIKITNDFTSMKYKDNKLSGQRNSNEHLLLMMLLSPTSSQLFSAPRFSIQFAQQNINYFQ